MQRNMTTDYRARFNALAKEAYRLRRYNWIKADKISQDAFQAFKNIEFKTDEDYRSAAEEARSAANNCYNNKDYQQAAIYYNEGVNYIETLSALNVDLSDNDYRNLIKLYIDMSDAYLNVSNRTLADWAFSNAIKAFKHIQVKTKAESIVANANDGYKSFREHYEAITTSRSHRESNRFLNNQQLLYGKREEDFLLDGISSLNVDVEKQNEENLESLFGNMNFSLLPQFTPMPQQQNVSDNEYRNVANELINIGKIHCSENKKSAAIDTLWQAINAYNKIRFKNEMDHATIEALKREINELKKPQTPKPPQIQSQKPQSSQISFPPQSQLFTQQSQPSQMSFQSQPTLFMQQSQPSQMPFQSQPTLFMQQSQPSQMPFQSQPTLFMQQSQTLFQPQPFIQQPQTQFTGQTQNHHPFGFANNPFNQQPIPRTSVTGLFSANTQQQNIQPFWNQTPLQAQPQLPQNQQPEITMQEDSSDSEQRMTLC